MCLEEVEKEETFFCTTMFRGSSLAVSCVAMYFKFYGSEYLREVLGETLDTVYKYGERMEVDPSRLTEVGHSGRDIRIFLGLVLCASSSCCCLVVTFHGLAISCMCAIGAECFTEA